MRQVLGAVLLAGPFIGLFALCVAAGGWRVALCAWGTGLLVAAMVLLGIKLLVGS